MLDPSQHRIISPSTERIEPVDELIEADEPPSVGAELPPAANLIPLLLEPRSLWAPFGERGGRHLALTELIQAGSVFPVSRVMEAMELP